MLSIVLKRWSREKEIGGTFKYRSYENAELVSSKQLTAFSDHRFPLDSPDHISLPQYVQYLQSYIDRFKLASYIKLGAEVISISPLGSGDHRWRHRVKLSFKDAYGRPDKVGNYDCSHIAIATGLHVSPNIPKIAGVEHVQGTAFHSSDYKSRSQLANRHVMILGCGETAMDITYEAIKANAHSVTMCFRTGFLSFPKVLNRFQVFGKTTGGSLPIDGLITNLFETAYVHHAIAKSRLRWFVSDFVIKRVLWFLTGTQAGCNQHIGGLPNERLGRAYVFLNKSSKAMPYLNRPYKQRDPVLEFMGNKYLDPREDADSDRWVDTCSFPSHVESDGTVIFEPRPDRKDWRRLRGQKVQPDCIVYCTGYKQDFKWLSPSYPTADQTNIRNIVKHDQPTIAFIGFVRPGVGAIPPIAEQQAMWWTALILKKMSLPTNPPHYHLLASEQSRIQYGVDYSAYMSTLARDLGGLPGLWQLWQEQDWRVLLAYCFGASFVTFYRLVGPFRSSAAPDIVKMELMQTIKRRGIVGNFFFGVIPMIFYGVLNLIAYALELVGLIPSEDDVLLVENGALQTGKQEKVP